MGANFATTAAGGIQEHRLDWPGRTDQLALTHMDELTLKDPFPVRIVFGELVPR